MFPLNRSPVSDSPVKVCNDTQGAEAPFFSFTPSGYWDYADPDADWGGDCMTGSNQSPIDIASGTTVTYSGLTFTSYGTTQSGSFTSAIVLSFQMSFYGQKQTIY